MGRTALFMPKHNGMGHVTRCLGIAQHLKQTGWDCIFDIAGPYQQLVVESGYKVVSNTSHKMRDLRTRAAQNVPPFVLCHKPIEDYNNFEFLQKEVQIAIENYRTINPTVLIGDMDWKTRLVGKVLDIRTVGIIQQQWYPGHSERWRCWWYDIPSKYMNDSNEVEIYNQLCKTLSVEPIEHFYEQWAADLLIIPGIPEIDRINQNDKYPVHYVGPILHDWVRDTDQEVSQWIERNSGYFIFASNGGTYSDSKINDLLISATRRANIPLLMAIGPQSTPINMDNTSTLKIVNFIDWRKTVNHASVNIHHGGHGSTMAAILAGQPSIITPFQCEQETQARMVMEQGAGLLVPKNKDPYKHFTFEADQLREAIGHLEVTLKEEDIIEALEHVQGVSYKTAVKSLKRKAEQLGGPNYSAQLIAKLVE
ncbi:hypothetical protein Elgi_52350 [Paenibacillus elgii]|uniref:glycosyltransferase n=1 Tax=Paenibacillus elgii TaxID=189691 RepID=UPI002D7D8FCC|nr:hypothetical protein Elgi_52350 [Paenibacillus elgii]